MMGDTFRPSGGGKYPPSWLASRQGTRGQAAEAARPERQPAPPGVIIGVVSHEWESRQRQAVPSCCYPPQEGSSRVPWVSRRRWRAGRVLVSAGFHGGAVEQLVVGDLAGRRDRLGTAVRHRADEVRGHGA